MVVDSEIVEKSKNESDYHVRRKDPELRCFEIQSP